MSEMKEVKRIHRLKYISSKIAQFKQWGTNRKSCTTSIINPDAENFDIQKTVSRVIGWNPTTESTSKTNYCSRHSTAEYVLTKVRSGHVTAFYFTSLADLQAQSHFTNS